MEIIMDVRGKWCEVRFGGGFENAIVQYLELVVGEEANREAVVL